MSSSSEVQVLAPMTATSDKMLLYTRTVAPKAPKKRSRAGCIHCKEKKKKCNEKRPQCDRCTERNLRCEYEVVQPRKRRRSSFAGSALMQTEPIICNDRWPGRFESNGELYTADEEEAKGINKWERKSSYHYPESEGSTVDWDGQFAVGNDVEEIIRTDLCPSTTTALIHPSPRSQFPDLAMIAPSPTASPLLEFCAPVFEEFTPRQNRRSLIDHFCNVLSHLIVFKEDTGNPFRQLVLPLAHSSSTGGPVLNAIFALSSAHLEYRGIENEEKSLDFHNKALQGLARLIEANDEGKREEIMGAIILLVYYEVLVQRDNSSIVNGHLKGAMTIMRSGSKLPTPATQFLEHAFRFYDVITALSLGTSPNSSSESTPSPFPSPAASVPEIESSQMDGVDTLLGLSTGLWPIIHRLSQLPSIKSSLGIAVASGQTSKATVLRTELENSSQAIELALTNWQPSLAQSESLSENATNSIQNTRLRSIVHNAEAYRHSAFVYLYRTIHSHPRHHPVIQTHAHASIQACFNVVQLAEKCYNGPMSALLWPLFVAACEAITEEDRNLAIVSFRGAERRQGMNNIMQAWEIVQEVWRRYDTGEGNVEWREICKERGMNLVFG